MDDKDKEIQGMEDALRSNRNATAMLLFCTLAGLGIVCDMTSSYAPILPAVFGMSTGAAFVLNQHQHRLIQLLKEIRDLVDEHTKEDD